MARRRNIDTTLEHALRIWAAQESRKLKGENLAGHQDAWAAACLLGKIREERDGASQNRASQRVHESHWGDGLLIQRAMYRMPESPWACVWLYYMLVGAHYVPMKVKVQYASAYLEQRLSLAEFWQELEKGEHWIGGRFFAMPDADGCLDNKNAAILA